MTAITTGGNGNWSSTTNNAPWAGGVVPIEGDTVIIASGHTVTLNQNATVGSDPGFGGTAALAITGVLTFDNAASRTLTLKGDLKFNSGGVLNIGSSGTRYNSSYVATIKFNYSASLVAGKYGMRVAYSTTSALLAYGASKKTNTTSTASCASGQKIISVADATGWVAGDVVLVGATGGAKGNTGQTEEMTIASISSLDVTMTANFTYTHASGAIISNITKNIVFTAYDATYGWFGDTRFGTAANHVLDNVEVLYCVAPSTAIELVSGYSINGKTSGEFSTGTFTDVTGYRNNYHLQFAGQYGGKNSNPTNCAFVGNGIGNGTGIFFQNSAYNVNLIGCNFFKIGIGVLSNFSAGGLFWSLTNCNIKNGNFGVQINAGGAISFNNCTIDGMATAAILTNSLAVDITDLGSSFGTFVPNGLSFSTATTVALITYTMTNANFQDTAFWGGTGGDHQNYLTSGAHVTLLNCTEGASSGLFKKYITNGVFIKNTTTQKNGVSSIELDTTFTGDCPYAFTFLAKTGVAYVIKGNMQYNTTYDDAAFSYPTVTVSGLGITPVVATATSSALSAWEAFTINVTQSSGADGLLTVTLNGNSATATGKAYFDGIVSPPFVTAARFYGYTFDETNPTRTVNPYVSASEATALAYTGIAIDWTAKTLVITTAHTMQEIYDYCQAQMSAAANLTKSEFLTTTDGLNYTLLPDWDFTVTNVVVTATGQHLYMSATGAWSVTGASGDFTGILTDATQTRVKINTTGIVAGSRIQLYDVTAAAELANEIVAGTSHSIAFTHTTDHSIRLRLTYTSGSATCYDWYTSTNTVTNTGLIFAAAQTVNDIYINNGIDGSTVTEASVSGTTIRIYIDDPDNTTTGQRIYNWYYYYLFTEAGIREQNGDYVTASDSTHITLANTMKIINQDTVNPLNLTGANITPVSGAATNIFDLTNAASICLNFNRVEGLSLNTTLTEVKSIVGDNQALIIAM